MFNGLDGLGLLLLYVIFTTWVACISFFFYIISLPRWTGPSIFSCFIPTTWMGWTCPLLSTIYYLDGLDFLFFMFNNLDGLGLLIGYV
jgi:hypothetical protein